MRALPPHPLARAGRESGFTLVEVLVSLVLLAFVLALAVEGIRYARRTWDAAARLDELAGSDTAETFIRARLAEAMPLYEQRNAGMTQVLFQGTSDAVSFVAPAPNGPAGAGLYRYTLESIPGARPAQRSLIVKLAPYQGRLAEPGAESAPDQHELMQDLRSVSFRYFGRSEIKAQPAWHAAWTRIDAIPSLVEMAIGRDDNEGGPVTMVIGLRLAR